MTEQHKIAALYCDVHKKLEDIKDWLAERNLPPSAVQLYQAQEITPQSWLWEEGFTDFRRGYEYASTQGRAVAALSRLSPEELFYAWSAINRGIGRGT